MGAPAPPLPDGRAIIINERRQQWMPGTFVVCQPLKSRCKQSPLGQDRLQLPQQHRANHSFLGVDDELGCRAFLQLHRDQHQ